MIRGGYWGGAWGLSWAGAWGEAWLLLNQPYQELSLKGQVFVRSYLTRIHSVEVAERIVSVAALNNISVIDAEVVVTAKQTVSTVDAVRRAKKARIDPAPAKTTINRPVEQVTTTSRAQTVFAQTDSTPIDTTAQTVWMGVVQQVKPIHAIRGDK